MSAHRLLGARLSPALAVALVLFAPRAYADDDDDYDANDDGEDAAAGPITYGSRLIFSGGAAFGEGTRPAWSDRATSYSIREYALGVRGTGRFTRENPLGSKFAFEWTASALLARESPEVASRDATSIEARGSVGVGGKAFDVGGSVKVALVLHANLEGGLGGQHWWSDTARLAPLAGPRFLFAFWESAYAEVDYAFVPDYVTSAPDDMRVNRWEHRASASFAYGGFGLGARYLLSSERTHTPAPDVARTHSSSVFLFLEWRVAP